jgi:hypothetical protein
MQLSSDAMGSIDEVGAFGAAMLADDAVVAMLEEAGFTPPFDEL